MKLLYSIILAAAFGSLQAKEVPLSPALQVRVNAHLKVLSHWGTDPKVISAVKAANDQQSAEAKAMTNEKWKTLSSSDPFVHSYTSNPLAEFLKLRRFNAVSEVFVSGAAGNKVAFLAKPSFWCHKDKDKHRVPMSGKSWVGPAEIDESSGELQIQVAFPVLDAGKPIGSIVVGLEVAKLK